MLSPELQVPVRVAADLFDRSSRLKDYLDRIGSGDSNDIVRLIAAIRRALESMEGATIKSLGEPWQAFTDDVDKRAAIDALWSTLGKFSREFATIHETLVLLPGEHTTPELGFTLQRCFADLYTDYAPSTVLGSIFNAFEFDFVEILKHRLVDIANIFLPGEEIVVLQLVICGRDSPLAYAILGHELGHAVDSRHKISDTIAGEFVKDRDTDLFDTVHKWCGELCADIVAARALGLAPILSLLSMEYCFHPGRNLWRLKQPEPGNPSRQRYVTHPMSRARLSVVLDELVGSLDRVLVDPDVEFYETACNINLQRWYQDEEAREAQRESQDMLYKNVIARMAQRVRAKLSELKELKLPFQGVEFRKDPIDRCVERLGRESLTSAQGDPRKELQRKVRLFKKQSFDTPEGRQRAFNTLSTEEFGKAAQEIPNDSQEARRQAFAMLCGKCTEKPLEIPKILLSGHLRRSQRLTELYTEDQPLSTREKVAKLCDSLAGLDHLVAGSIVTTCVHERVLERLSASKEGQADV